jgi:hypothetical protein
VISAPLGNCYFSAYAGITGADSLPWAGNDMWNPISGATTTMYANNPGDFYVVANMPAGNTAVVAYPDTAVNFTRAVSAYHSITSSFTETMNPVTGTNAEASYDIWFSNGGAVNEVMIQNDFSPGRVPSCAWAATNVQFGGSNGVPVHTWNLCQGATTSWWVIADGNFSSGSVDILAMVNWLISHGHLGQGATFGTLSYGWEISSTGGQDETFRVSDFTISAS